jgi:hypothetical protein
LLTHTRIWYTPPGLLCPAQGCAEPLPAPIKVVGCGSSGVDYLASVAAYPRPDEKLRTDTLEVQGGGNCANALTAAARLGLSPTIVTKASGRRRVSCDRASPPPHPSAV